MRCMSETPGPSTPPVPVAASPAPQQRPERLYQVAAWVAIVAGIVFVVATALLFVCAFWCCG
ncbi:hypothetical protein I552_3367 [Mycobacterium xenopi 3993]|nr:hypothetical protein I552_3367 [Mycobacterium xenopi 3993]